MLEVEDWEQPGISKLRQFLKKASNMRPVAGAVAGKDCAGDDDSAGSGGDGVRVGVVSEAGAGGGGAGGAGSDVAGV